LVLSLLLVLAGPHLDIAIERRGWRAVRAQGGELRGVLWRTFRIVVAFSIFAILATLWLLPILDVAGISRGIIVLKAAEILMLVLVIAFYRMLTAGFYRLPTRVRLVHDISVPSLPAPGTATRP